jgi:shikimate dehydrogenase
VEIYDQARLFGVLGDPVDHSLSPLMHNAAFAALGLPHLYLRYRVTPASLPRAMREIRTLGMRGLNLTVPLKEAALPLCDALTPEAQRIAAVNTLIVRSRTPHVLGDNTDGRGFLAAVRGSVRVRGARAVVIGAGGSARAVTDALAGAGCSQIVIANRSPRRGEDLADRLQRRGVDAAAVPLLALKDGAVLEDAGLVVNATPVGLGTTPLAIRYRATPRRCLFVDLVYGTRPTSFLTAAARARRPTLGGASMLLEQGALAFEAWTGRRAPRAVMARALRMAGLTLTGLHAAATLFPRRPPTP